MRIHSTNTLTFFFTSDVRVDFRKLVKGLVTRFGMRVGIRQLLWPIASRQ